MCPTDNIRTGPKTHSGLMATHLVKRFGRQIVLKDVDIKCAPGEIIGLLGPNGAGKTTIFKIVAGALKPDDGRVLLGGADITGLPIWKRAEAGIGYLAQEPSVFSGLTVRQNLQIVLEAQRAPAHTWADSLSAVMNKVGIDDLAGRKALTLSGGERRKVEIARLMLLNPRILLFDEPFSGIDPLSIAAIQCQMREFRQHNVGIIITDHQVKETLHLCDRVYIIHNGSILAMGTPQEIVADPDVRLFYLGEEFLQPTAVGDLLGE